MQFGRIKTQVVEHSGRPVRICRLDLKNKAVRGVARSYRGGILAPRRVSRDLLALNVTFMFPANDI
jgi:hypothetical protein